MTWEQELRARKSAKYRGVYEDPRKAPRGRSTEKYTHDDMMVEGISGGYALERMRKA